MFVAAGLLAIFVAAFIGNRAVKTLAERRAKSEMVRLYGQDWN